MLFNSADLILPQRLVADILDSSSSACIVALTPSQRLMTGSNQITRRVSINVCVCSARCCSGAFLPFFCFGQFVLLLLLDGASWLVRRKYVASHPLSIVPHESDNKVCLG
jgi:hypothetical protein